MWLAALSFVLRSFAADVPEGHALCIGCESSVITISRPCAPIGPSDCCDDGHDEDGSDGPEDCNCVDVPLGDGPAVKATVVRLDLGGADLGKLVPFEAPLAWTCASLLPEPQPVVRSRAGPELGAGIPPPMARRTVLIV